MEIYDKGQETAAESAAKVFISYSRKDLAFVDRLAAALAAHHIVPAVDRTEIYAFEDWWKRIEALIAAADTVIFALSPDAVASDICRKEVERALALNKRFAPIVCRSVAAEMDKIPPPLGDLNFIFFDAPNEFDAALAKLVEALQTDIGWVRLHTAYGLDAFEWEKAARPASLVLRSPRLEEAERWIATRPPGAPVPTGTTQAFILASRRGATRRRNMLTGSLAAGLILAVALTGVALWQRGLAVNSRNAAVAAERTAIRERQQAERNANAAQEAARALVFDLAQSIRDHPGMPQDLVELILDRADQVLHNLTLSIPDAASFRHLRAQGLLEIGETLERKGERRRAMAIYDDCRSILEGLVASAPNDDAYQIDLAIVNNRIGNALLQSNDVEGALIAFKRSNALRRKLVEINGSDRDRILGLALSQRNLALVKLAQHDQDGALELLEDGRSQIQRLVEADPQNSRWPEALAEVEENIGDTLRNKGDVDSALQAYRIRIGLLQDLVKSNRGDFRLAFSLGVCHSVIADILAKLGKPAEALASYRESQKLIEKVSIENPDIVIMRTTLGILQKSIGFLLIKQREFKNAGMALGISTSILREIADEDRNDVNSHEGLFEAAFGYGIVRENQFEPEDALRGYREALRASKTLTVIDPAKIEWQIDVADSFDAICKLKGIQRDFDEATSACQSSFDIAARLAERNPENDELQRRLMISHIELGNILLRSSKITEAQKHASIALALAAARRARAATTLADDDLALATSLSQDVRATLENPKTP